MASESTVVEISPTLKVEINGLTTMESIKADNLIGNLLGDNPSIGGMTLLTNKVYALCSVRKINDVPMGPLAGGAAFDAVCAKFSLTDLMKLIMAYDSAYGVKVDEIKNESSEEVSET